MPDNISAVANAKSSTGRLDILTRLISDNSSCFDRVRKGYKGKVYVEIAPISFSIIIKEGVTLNQLRFHNEQQIITDRQLEKLNTRFNIVENATAVASYTVTDPDAGDTVRWSITGVDSDKFFILIAENLNF